jgi:hypothetical protein
MKLAIEQEYSSFDAKMLRRPYSSSIGQYATQLTRLSM